MWKEADQNVLAPIYETVCQVRASLDDKTALIGFCGAPWTVATYMVAGHATADQAPARLFAHRDPETFSRLIDYLVDASIEYLAKQLQAGADCVQIFDTWAGVLGPEQFDRWCIGPTQKIVEGVRRQVPRAKIIGFPRGAGAMALAYAEMTGVSAIGLDWTFERVIARDALQSRVPVQGNVDPLALLAGGVALDRDVDDVLRHLADGPLIFNLGHGILPETPIAPVERMLRHVRREAERHRWVEGLHIVAVIAWMAGMLYLPRLFVYHAAGKVGSEQSETFKTMEYRLLNFIMMPAMAITWIAGIALVLLGQWFSAGWFQAKFVVVIAMTVARSEER